MVPSDSEDEDGGGKIGTGAGVGGWYEEWKDNGRGGMIWEGEGARQVGNIVMQMVGAGIVQWGDLGG